MDQMDSQQERRDETAARPAWRRPELTVLDVEQGTVAMSGPHADGYEASTS